MKWLDQFQAARRSGVPIIVIRTTDYQSVISEINKYATEKNAPVCQWDICRGVMGVNKLGSAAAIAVNSSDLPQPAAIVTGNPVEALQKCLAKLPEKSIICAQNLQIILESRDDNRIAVIQGIWNCRDPFKGTKRTLVLLVPQLAVPPELSSDVITLDTDLPTQEELGKIVADQFKAASLPAPEKEVVERAVDSLSGLSEFSAEQVTAMSLGRDGLDLTAMWERKRSIIQQTGGLSVETRKVSFDDLGGLDQIKKFARLIINGKRRPKLVVLID